MIFNKSNFESDLQKIINANVPFDELHNKTVLITGANGLIASYLIDVLMYLNTKKGLCINIYALCRNIDKAERRFKQYLKREEFKLVIQDVCDPLQLDIKIDYIIHAASNAHPLAYAINPVETMQANILGTLNLLNYAVNHNNTRFMFVSSSEVYGENPNIEQGFDEKSWGKIDTMNPRACYSESKRAAETICTCYKKQHNLDIVVVRPGYIYGPSITEDNSRADAQFLRNVVNKEDIIMKSAGNQLRSYCYVGDAITALLTVLLRGENGQAYNIANPSSEVTIRQFAEVLASTGNVELRLEIPEELEKQGYSNVTKSVLITKKLENLGWKPIYSIEEGVARTVSILSYSNPED